MSKYTDEDFERIGQQWRLAADVDDLHQPDMLAVLETLKKRGAIADYVQVPDSELPNAEGRYDPKTRVIELPDRTWFGAKAKESRANWSVAHELGHVAFRPSRARNRSTIKPLIEKIVPAIKRDEHPANRFAAAFLAAYDKANFSQASTIDQIAERFNLSCESATIRRDEFARIHRRRNGIERKLPKEAVAYLQEARNRGRVVKSLPPPRDDSAPPANPLRATSEVLCTVRGCPTLSDIGSTKAICASCRSSGDMFQDGDSV